tara:strand:+ start:117 stop:629 length:513 start_codon:yes stop_codon:yes gene_type:complete
MAAFNNNGFHKHNDYMSPKHVWEDIKQFLPKDKIIWEAFYGDGKSGKDLQSLGYEVIHEDIDFFTNTPDYDYICSNPPYQYAKDVLTHMKELDKPFILIMPASKICTQYFRKLFSKETDNPIQIIIPRKRIQFIKLVDGKVPENFVEKCNFDCFYYCWKMNLPRDIVWLE